MGGCLVWVNSYSGDRIVPNQQELLEEMLSYSEIVISEEHYSCEGKPVKTVGAVVASLLESNNSHTRNILSYGCYGLVCTMSVSNCKPWQESECGSRYLKFNLNNVGNIEASSFTCFDMP